MKQKLNIITRAIMVAFLSSASISTFASYEEAIDATAQELKQDSCNVERCSNVNVCDSINMPVFIVDGVEVQVQDLDSLPLKDIVSMKVVQDEAIRKIFSPRLGAVILLTTKSKRFLNPVLENYNRRIEEGRQNRIPGQFLIRGDQIKTDSAYTWDYPYVHPSFPGGDSALVEFVKSNLRYPEEAKRNNEHGRVIVNFVIDIDGTVTDPFIFRGVSPALDAEALSIVSIMPKWMPGSFNGELKKVRYTLPIRF